MANIDAKMVKELRDKTGAGMMDCKKALVAADGDSEKAMEQLRKAGIAKAEKKASRSAKEGAVFVSISDDKAAAVEVLCETDFVARNEKFQNYSNELAARIASDFSEDGDVSEKVAEMEKDTVTEMVARIGENMQVRRAVRWDLTGKAGSYLHGNGRIGVVAEVEGECSDELLTDICMHIAAFAPAYITPDEIPAETIAKEKEIAAAQVQGKPENIIEKIVVGKINKWYTEVCLMKMPWIRDDKTCLEKVAPGLKVKRFIRWQVGEEL